jgi:uncharacterized paraquat-inducible protein A
MSLSTQPTFVCPECDGRIPVTEATREAVLRSGCPRCAATVTADDFVTK